MSCHHPKPGISIAVFAKILDFIVSQSASFVISAVPFSKSNRSLPHFLFSLYHANMNMEGLFDSLRSPVTVAVTGLLCFSGALSPFALRSARFLPRWPPAGAKGGAGPSKVYTKFKLFLRYLQRRFSGKFYSKRDRWQQDPSGHKEANL